ncbi:sodium:solute symporter family protein [Pseudoalteromonas sp. BSi20429]|uniref:sodium:solute symporter family protein n=1 Tax=Pseudoalteromonas sp. BSi20429 TaxID=1097676 RepID=UPI0002318D54|nr:sodium:solute symporter family protein [Pseudoalteromonas sp. BSi20429]GAA67689.1 solute:Na+ symporter, SSS family [Pseudoalteromonas sp. BSi20429]
MHIIDISVVVIFSLLIIGCGLSFSAAGKNMKSFFSAGGALPWWMSGLSLFMSFFSAGTFVVWGAIAYKHGWVAITIQWTMCLAGVLIALFIAPKWQKTGVLTAAEFIKQRLGLNVQRTYTYIFLLIASFSTGAFLYPVAKIVEVATGLSLEYTVIILGLLILAYTAVGGLWAVIITDILQFVVLTAAVLIVVPLSFEAIGGIENFIDKAPDDFFNLVNDEYSWEFIFAFGLYNLFFIAGNWSYIQRFTSVKTPKDAKKVGGLFAILYLICPVVWMLAPMIYRTMNPSLVGFESEGAYLQMCKEVLPVGMLGLMLAGMVFATSSSINTSLNIAAGVISNDIYKNIKPDASQATLVKVGRIATGVLGLITIIVALLIPLLGGVVEVVMTMAALTGGPLFLPPIWLLFSRYQTGKTILITTIFSLLVNAFFKFVSPWLFDFSLDRAQEMMMGVLFPVLMLTVFELYLRAQRKTPACYENYLVELSQIKPTAELITPEKSADNNHGIRVLGFGILSTGAIMLSLAAIATTGKIEITVISSGIFILGGVLVFKFRSKAVKVRINEQ